MPEAVTRQSLAGLLERPDGSLLDLVDSLLDKGVVLDGELILGIADIDLVYVRLGVLLAAADRILPRTTCGAPLHADKCSEVVGIDWLLRAGAKVPLVTRQTLLPRRPCRHRPSGQE